MLIYKYETNKMVYSYDFVLNHYNKSQAHLLRLYQIKDREEYANKPFSQVILRNLEYTE